MAQNGLLTLSATLRLRVRESGDMGSSESTQSQEEEQSRSTLGTTASVGAAVLALGCGAVSAWALSRRNNDDVPNQTMMRAPGRRGEYIRRDVFEGDPKAYFASLRK